MKALLKEHGWKVCVCLIWYISADYPFRNLPFYWQILCWFLFIIALDIMIWILKPEKKQKEKPNMPMSDDLDKAAIEYSRYFGEWDYAIPCFKAGAEWQRFQKSKYREENNICWNDMTDKEKSDFLFLPSHQKSAAKPVSEELEEASKEWLKPQLDKSYASYGEGKMMELTRFDGYAMLDAVEFGAKWKERQFEKNRLAHCDELTAEQAQIESDFVNKHLKENNRTPTFIDAIEYGMKLQKEQMMKGAFIFRDEHNIACCLASECLRNHGWFMRESDFNDLWKYISNVKELFKGEFYVNKEVKIKIIKEE